MLTDIEEGMTISDAQEVIEWDGDLSQVLKPWHIPMILARNAGRASVNIDGDPGKPVPKHGRVRYSDFKTQFTFQGLEEQEPQELHDFVDEHGPIAAPEVMEVYGIQREEAIQRLEDLDGVSSFKVSGEQF